MRYTEAGNRIVLDTEKPLLVNCVRSALPLIVRRRDNLFASRRLASNSSLFSRRCDRLEALPVVHVVVYLSSRLSGVKRIRVIAAIQPEVSDGEVT